MRLDLLKFSLRKLFICADGLENQVHKYSMDDLFYGLLNEIEQVKRVYEDCENELEKHI